LERLLELALKEGASRDALVAYVRARGEALLRGRVPLHELVMSKLYSKLEYASRALPHLAILAKCERRGLPVPELGSRIAFLIVRGAKREKAYERAETVDYVLQHQLPVDYRYYFEQQFRKPMLRILDWIFGFREVPKPRKRHSEKDRVK